MQLPSTAFIGIGANLGDARSRVRMAIEACAALSGTSRVATSSLYRTAPIDSSGDDYINAVLRLDTPLSPIDLLDALQVIELQHGRERPYRNAPRTLDLDLLLHGGQVLDLPRLQVPHPRLHQRAFVLVPLLEISPSLVLPGRGLASDFLASVADQRIERLAP